MPDPDDHTTATDSSAQTTVAKADKAPDPDHPDKVDSPADMPKTDWKVVAKRAWFEFTKDQCTDIAASLTYYSVLALFPALIALVSLLGVFGQGQDTVNSLMDMLTFIPADTQSAVRPVIAEMVNAKAAGFALVTGLLGALWSSSGYIQAFGRAMNRIYEVTEGRPVWKLKPIQLGLTLVVLLLTAVVLTGLVVSGPVAQTLGDAIGLGDTAVTVWSWLKWPLMLVFVGIIVALLYYVTPNVKQPKFRWISIGAAVAIAVWILVSIVFGLYVANFGSYNKTYGTLAGVVIGLLWLWLTNLSLMFGAEVDAELERTRQLRSGIKAEETLQLPPRDTKGTEKRTEKEEDLRQEGRLMRLEALKSGVTPPDADGDAKGTSDGGRSDHGATRTDA